MWIIDIYVDNVIIINISTLTQTQSIENGSVVVTVVVKVTHLRSTPVFYILVTIEISEDDERAR